MYASLAYVPPDRFHPDAFVQNVKHFKSEYPVIWYSDRDIDGAIRIPDPTNIKLSRNRVAIHNRLFLHALEIAQKRNLKRFIYLESDTRVCHDGWDKRIFDEASQYKDMFCAGTGAIFNYKAMDMKQRLAVNGQSIRSKAATGFNVPDFKSRTTRPMGAWFIMGAGAVYSTPIAAELFMGFERDAHQKAIKVPAYDLFFGLRCVQLFKERAVTKLPFLTSVFSTFGNKINTERDRIEMARSGKWGLIHQIKSNSDCI